MTNDPSTSRHQRHAAGTDRLPDDPEKIVGTVREHYARIAGSRKGESCCGPTCSSASATMGYRSDDLEQLPSGADMGLGCGAPVDHLGLGPGEVALDLGSGGGIDVFLAARQVGPSGRVLGIDMTPEMIAKAEASAARAGISNVEFRQGRIEALPVEDASIDAVTSNCVINLVPDKSAVYREIARVLKPGGRLVISDVILERRLPEAVESHVLAHAGCVSGAMLRDTYFGIVRDAGLVEVTLLSQTDFLAAVAAAQPEEVRQFEEQTGVRLSELRGAVTSVTFRAFKPNRS